MDTSRLEKQGENYISSELTRFGLDVSKPLFDINGADLRIEKNINNKYLSIILVQCKTRSIKKGNSNNIIIPESYVNNDNFIVVLYLIEENGKINLFCFFKEQMQKWSLKNGKYSLSIPYNFEKKSVFELNKLNNSSIIKINSILENQKLKNLKKDTTLIIDGIFLEKAVIKTRELYKKIYPDKILKKPKINDLIRYFYSYARFENSINKNFFFFVL